MNPITLPVSELKPSLGGLGKVINLKSNPLIAQCIKIERTAEGWIALTTTDLDSFITVRLEQPSTGAPLVALVPFEQLASLIKGCGKEEQVHVTPNTNNTVTLKFQIANRLGESVIKAPPATEFPPIPKIPNDSAPLPPAVRYAIHEAMACASDDPTRQILHGAFIDVSQAKTHYVIATDGRQLYSSNSFNLPLRESVLIPKHKFLGWKEFNNDGEWQMKTSDTWLQINSRRWRFITRQIEGVYPKWRMVVPDQPARTTIALEPQSLDGLIQTIEKLPCHEEKYHTLGIQFKEGHLNLLAKKDRDEPWIRVPVHPQKVEGRDITVFLDRQLLVKALQFRLNNISLIDEISPLKLSSEGRQMIVMPLRPESTPHPPQPMPEPPRQIKAKEIAHSRPSEPPSESRPLESALAQIEDMKTGFREGLNGLTRLSDIVRGALREQKVSNREYQSIRQTLQRIKL